MGIEPMELAKNWDPKNSPKILPAYAQIKYDGVPLCFMKFPDGFVKAITRQNEIINSVPHLSAEAHRLVQTGGFIIAECFVPGRSFKDSSGIIRRHNPDNETAQVIGKVFDYCIDGVSKKTYFSRRLDFFTAMDLAKLSAPMNFLSDVGSIKVEDVEAVDAALAVYKEQYGEHLEGIMLHTLTKPFQAGKRCLGMSRYKPQPTIDLVVESYEEAISEDGEGLGMVGRVNVVLRRRKPGQDAVVSSIVGIGPGKLSHAQRASLWERAIDGGHKRYPHGLVPTYAEIKYMPDESYEALRQPTVQRIRYDKTEGDILNG